MLGALITFAHVFAQIISVPSGGYGDEWGVVTSKRVVDAVDPPALVEVPTGRKATVVRPRRVHGFSGHRYLVKVRYCFTSCVYVEVDVPPSIYDLAMPDLPLPDSDVLPSSV